MDPIRRLRLSIFFLILVIGLGTCGYCLIEGWSPFDALYMTVITLATVGFREVHELSDAGKGFTILLIIFGAGIIAYTIGSVAQFMMEGQLRTLLGRRKVEKDINKLKDHYIICGYGRIGALIGRELRTKPLPFVVVEKSPHLCEKLDNDGVLYVQGNATDDEALIAAGILRARGLITVVTSDTDNVYITLTARGLNPDLFILARAGEEGSEKKLQRAGASKVISPYTIGAGRMAQAILRPSVMDFIEIATAGQNLELQLEEILVGNASTLIGRSLITSGIRKDLGLIIVGIKKCHGQMLFNPAPETIIEASDTLIALGQQSAIQNLERISGGLCQS
ncbi:MAG: potassium transporter TrkA [Desulfuromonadales bacterium GWD2_61_12]|nr:MAG: potassium transporter TrkA [Desulfuromonadales bacterium GWC2_61_20]OGR36388.1 MAG: potassium transporter TrkA [Desulfuromonadales bacterium GWD2_61_12]HAD03735.1 potassium channel protein [Desulfuromonas sp.]